MNLHNSVTSLNLQLLQCFNKHVRLASVEMAGKHLVKKGNSCPIRIWRGITRDFYTSLPFLSTSRSAHHLPDGNAHMDCLISSPLQIAGAGPPLAEDKDLWRATLNVRDTHSSWA